MCALGTSLSEHQIDLLAKLKKEVIVVYDSDSKGIMTMKKVMPLLDENGIRAKLIILPSNKDLADISYEYQYSIEKYINDNKMTYGYYCTKNAIDSFNKDLYNLYDKYHIIFDTVLNEVPLSEKNTINAYINNNVYGKEFSCDMQQMQEQNHM
jgi:DNA primase